jgi:DNA (cytosine-5)-methyltransferase 1
MKQLSLSHMFGAAREDAPVDGLEVYDLFCGAGGFSCGAVAAGCKVVFACDVDQESLTTHQLNHPDAVHRRVQLPAELPLPVDGRPFHLHGSPPCQRFSSMGKIYRTEGDTATPTNLVEWYLETALASQATSWSMEQVCTPEVVQIVERVRRANTKRMAYHIFRLDELGVPQTRKRLIAGPPQLIARLRRLCSSSRRRSMRDALPHVKATHIRTTLQWKRKWLLAVPIPGKSKFGFERTVVSPTSNNVRPLSRPAPTILTSGDLRWAWWVGGKVRYRKITVRECAALQTFPPGYRWPVNKHTAHQQVGNAVPPLVAELMLTTRPRMAVTLSPSLRRPAPTACGERRNGIHVNVADTQLAEPSPKRLCQSGVMDFFGRRE